MSLFLSCMFYFVAKIRKTCYRKKIKDSVCEAYLLTKETSSWFLLIGSLKMTFARSCQVLEGSNHFSWHVLPKHSKITLTCPKWVKKPNRVNFDFPEVSRININFELSKVSEMTSLKIYISPVTQKLEISNLDTW